MLFACLGDQIYEMRAGIYFAGLYIYSKVSCAVKIIMDE
jgi:hypothetical protein